MIKKQGFTILELLITLTIAVILASVALPAFNNLIADSRLTASTNAVVGIHNLARSEAIEAASPVIVEQTAGNGYQIRNLTTNDVLRVIEPPNADITITASAASVTFQANGYRVFGSPDVTIELCHDNGECSNVAISSAGRVAVK